MVAEDSVTGVVLTSRDGGPQVDLAKENAKLKWLRAELSVDKRVRRDIAARNDLDPICGQNGGQLCHSNRPRSVL
jgi:hypothetical protein